MPNRHGSFFAWTDASVGTTMVSSYFWSGLLEAASNGLHFIVMLCGAIIGIHGVYRIFKGASRMSPDERVNE